MYLININITDTDQNWRYRILKYTGKVDKINNNIRDRVINIRKSTVRNK